MSVLFGTSQPDVNVEKGKLQDTAVQTSTYGNTIPLIFGTTRVGGNVIWINGDKLTEVKHVSSSSTGGKGGGGAKVKTTTYTYFASFATAFAEGEADEDGLLKVWGDGKLIFDGTVTSGTGQKYTDLTLRFYPGSETQLADPAIQADIGVADTPPYKGIAYLVIDSLPVADFGNRIPNLTALIRFKADNADLFSATDFGPGALGAQGATPPDRDHPRPENFNAQGLDEGGIIRDPNRSVAFVIADDVGAAGADQRDGTAVQRLNLNTDLVEFTRDLLSTGDFDIDTVTAPEVWNGGMGPFTIDQLNGHLIVQGRQAAGTATQGIKLLNPYNFETLRVLGSDEETSGLPKLTGIGQANDICWLQEPLIDALDSNTGRFIIYFSDLSSGAVLFMGVGTDPLQPFKMNGDYRWPNDSSAPNMDDCVRDRNNVIWASGIRNGAGPMLVGVAFSDRGPGATILTTSLSATHLPRELFKADVGNTVTQGGLGFAGSPFEFFSGTLRIVAYDEPTHSLILMIPGARLSSDPGPDDGGKIIRVDIDTLLFGDTSGAALPDQNKFLAATVATLSETATGDFLGSQLGGAHRTSLKCGTQNGIFVLPNESGATGAKFTKYRVIDCAIVDQYDGEDWEDGTDVTISFAGDTGVTRSTICWDGRNNSVLAAQTFNSTRLGWRRFFLDRQTLTDPLVSNIILDVCARAGIPNSDVDVSDLVTKGVRVSGYAMQEVVAGRTALQPLLQLLNIDGFESGHVLKFRQRGDTTADFTIVEDELGGSKGLRKSNLKLKEESKEDQDIPVRIDVVHNDPARDYQESNQHDQRTVDPLPTTGNSAGRDKVQSPIVLSATEARQAASRLLYSRWTNRKKFDFNVMQEFAAMDPADLVSVTHDGRTVFGRVTQVKFGDSLLVGVLMLEEEPSVYTSVLVGDGNPGGLLFAGTRIIPFTGPTEVYPMDIPLLQDSDDTSSLVDPQCIIYVFMAGLEPDWRGAVLSRSNTGEPPFDQIEANFVEFAWGTLRNAVPAYADLADDVNVGTIPNGVRHANNIRTFEPDEGSITVQIVRGEDELASTDEAGILDGQNAAIIGNEGSWEVIQYHTVIDNGANEFELRGLVRGRRGTEPEAIAGHAAGGFFFQIRPQAVLVQRVDQTLISGQVHFRADTVGASMFEGVARPVDIECNSLKPYSPALDSCIIDTGGTEDVTLIWIRRTRVGDENDWGDAVTEVPLGEASEQYEVDVLDSVGTVVRTFTNASVDIITNPLRPRIVYTNAQQVTDGFTPGFPVTFKLYQLSAEVGRGFALDVTCTPEALETPESLNVDLFWLDASDSSTITESGGAGTGVSDWADKSTAEVDWSQSSAGQRPQVDLNTLNGLTVVTFDGSDDHLDRAANVTGRGDFTWVFLVNNDSVATGNEVILETQNFRVLARTNQTTNGPNSGGHVQLEAGATTTVNGRVLGSTASSEIEGFKTLGSTYSVIIVTMDGSGQTMTLEVDGDILRNGRVSLTLDPQGNTQDRFSATGTLIQWGPLGFLTGDDVDVEDVPVADTGVTDIEVTNTSTYTRQDGGSFLTDGFLVDMGIVSEGFTNAANNHDLGDLANDIRITTVTASTLVITGAVLTVETGGGGNERIVHDPNAPNTIGTFGNLPTVGFDNVTISTSTMTIDSGGADPDVQNGPTTVGTGTIRQRSNIHPQGTVQAAAGTTVGSDNTTAERFEGSMAEMMGWSRQLSATEKLQMRLYLVDKWAL